MKQHIHAKLIKAWADGADIQIFTYGHTYDWVDCKRPTWNEKHLFRIKPKEREWAGLTEDDLKPLCDEWKIIFGGYVNDFAKAIEAKLKEKND